MGAADGAKVLVTATEADVAPVLAAMVLRAVAVLRMAEMAVEVAVVETELRGVVRVRVRFRIWVRVNERSKDMFPSWSHQKTAIQFF
jgi:hypothetical protein